MLALSGDTSISAMLCIPGVVLIEWRNVADAVAVRAIMWTLWGKMLLTSPNRRNSVRNDSPLWLRKWFIMTKIQSDCTHHFLMQCASSTTNPTKLLRYGSSLSMSLHLLPVCLHMKTTGFYVPFQGVGVYVHWFAAKCRRTYWSYSKSWFACTYCWCIYVSVPSVWSKYLLYWQSCAKKDKECSELPTLPYSAGNRGWKLCLKPLRSKVMASFARPWQPMRI